MSVGIGPRKRTGASDGVCCDRSSYRIIVAGREKLGTLHSTSKGGRN